jgi:hypothetical protein
MILQNTINYLKEKMTTMSKNTLNLKIIGALLSLFSIGALVFILNEKKILTTVTSLTLFNKYDILVA